ncbi:Macrophage killing protein with similarity to conjugation protein [compost metagenome]
MNNKNKKNVAPKSVPQKQNIAEASGLYLVEERNNFYRDMYSKMWKIATVGVVSMALSIGMSIYVFNKKESNVYFATNEANSLIKLVPLSVPNMRDNTVANWLTTALIDTFDFNYVNYIEKMNSNNLRYFTGDGATQLVNQMKDTGNIDVIVKRKLLVNLTTLSTPILLRSNNREGAYKWEFQIPAKITYRNETNEYSNTVLFNVIVKRTSLLEHPSGLGIASVVMKVAKGD